MAPASDIWGGTAGGKCATCTAVFSGSQRSETGCSGSECRAALLAGEKVETLEEGVSFAQEIIDSGKALAKLEQSNRVYPEN